jgi:putative membrane protein
VSGTRQSRALGAVALLGLALPGDALAHGDRVPVSGLASAWRPAPAVLAGAGIALPLFGQAFVRLRRRGRVDHAGTGRAALFLLGLALATLALVSPLDAVGEEYLLSAHMLQHVLIGDAAPALVLLAVRGPLLFFLLPSFALRPLAGIAPLRALLASLLRPRVSLAFWVLAFGLWHVPALYDYALTHGICHDLEHASFLLAGLLVWAQLVDPGRRGMLRPSGRLVYAALLLAAGQTLADALALSVQPHYPAYAAQDERLLGLSPLADQRLAGIVMIAEQLLTLGSLAAILLARQLGRDARVRRRRLSPDPRP